ncbi:tetratricopeptide repeat protein [Spirochaetia bacterium 38H-sp]|uniref:Tetratricopeptide repeat protein n=1 Tax=Rarispira pelagica TaxID=3141764 RepID=A0ABU9UD20_9SPIR
MISRNDPLENVFFINLPEDLDYTIGNFRIEADIPIPVEAAPGENTIKQENLSWEMLVSGMLKIMAYQPGHKHADYYRKFIFAVKPDIVGELSETGVFKAKQKEFDLAEEIFLALTGLEPDNPAHLLNLAVLYEERAKVNKKLDNIEAAEEYTKNAFYMYKRIFSLDKDIPKEAYLNAGFFYSENNNYSEALEHFKQYLKHQDVKPEMKEKIENLVKHIERSNLADTLFDKAYQEIINNNEEKGIQLIKQFIRDNPDVWNAWFLLGWGYRRIKKFAEAAEAFEKANLLNPNHTETLNELAICYTETNRLSEAKDMLYRALKDDSENVKIISNLGIIALKEGNKEEAINMFKVVLEFSPDDPIAKEYIKILEKK